MMRASQFVLARQTPAVAAYASSRLSPSDAVQFMQGSIGTQYESSCDHCRVVSHLGIASELDTSPLVTVRGADWCQLVDTAEQREWKDLHSEGYTFFDDLAMNISDPLTTLYATQATSDVAAVESQIVEDAHWEQLRALSAAIRGTTSTSSPSTGHQQHFDADHIAAGYLGHQPSSAEAATLSATHQEDENIIDEIRAFGTPAVQSEDLEQLTHEAYAGGLDSNLEDEPDRSLSSSDKPKSVKKKQVVKPLHFKPSSVDISAILSMTPTTQRKPTLVDNTTTTAARDGAAPPTGPKEIDGVVASSTAEPSTHIPHTDEADTTSPRLRAWSARKRTATHKHR